MARKLLVMFVLIAVTCSGSAWAIPGDVNDDDAVTLSDAITALQMVAGMTDLTVNTADDVYVTGEKVIGLPEAIYALREVSTTDTITDNSGLGMTFVRIPAGTFMMGSPTDEPGRDNNETLHQVTLTQDFYMMTTEVTQAQWQAVMGSNPSDFTACGSDCPVETVSWNDAQDFIAALKSMEGRTYRLPTEAEWEYAARAGTTTAFYSGEITHTGSSPVDPNLDAIGWYSGNSDVSYTPNWSGLGTHPMAQKQLNAWGLYDMSGNVWEWVQDWYGGYPDGAVTDPAGPETGSYRVLRGGSWDRDARRCRSASRGYVAPSGRGHYFGFRLALSPGQ